jgi:hypothetical protein
MNPYPVGPSDGDRECPPPEPGDKAGLRCARPVAGAPYPVQGFTARNRDSGNSPPEPRQTFNAQRATFNAEGVANRCRIGRSTLDVLHRFRGSLCEAGFQRILSVNRGKVGPRCARPGAGAPAPYRVHGRNSRPILGGVPFHEPGLALTPSLSRGGRMPDLSSEASAKEDRAGEGIRAVHGPNARLQDRGGFPWSSPARHPQQTSKALN